MKPKAIIHPAQTASHSRTQKQIYKSPLLREYGAVHQFTQGTMGAASDASVNMTKGN